MIFQGMGTFAHAERAEKEVGVKVTNFKLLSWQKEETDKIFYTDSFYLSMDWDASGNGTELHKGDYFNITLPDKMKFPSKSSAVDFDLYALDGHTVIAKAHVTPNENGGGTVKVIFTDYVENKYNVKGNIFLAARFDRTKIKLDQQNLFSITISGQVLTTTTNVIGPKDLKNETLLKWGSGDENKRNGAVWSGRINHMGSTLHNVVITDTLGDSGETFLKDTFSIQKIKFDAKGNITQVVETVDLTNKLVISPDGKTFTLKMGDLSGDQYQFNYRTTYTPGTRLKNIMLLTSIEVTKNYEAVHQSSSSGGSGAGDLTNKIKIIKVDSENQEKACQCRV